VRRGRRTLSVGCKVKSSGGFVMTYRFDDGRWDVVTRSRNRYRPIHRMPKLRRAKAKSSP